MNEAFAASIASQWIAATALSSFALFALILAAAGIAAVVSFKVAARRHEIGVRMALGADGGDVRRLIVIQSMVPVFVGAACGLGIAFLLVQVLAGQIGGLESLRPLTVGLVLGVLSLTAGVASLLPAWRAVRMDPLRALRPD